jgi:mannose-6-phosphate isomerase-like protein (cupin superfamily)
MENFKKLADAIRFSQEKMTKSNVFETERLFCDLYCFEPGQAQNPHTHEGSDKVYFVLEGRGRFQIGQEERELGEKQIALAPSGQRHGVSNPGPGRLVLLVLVAPKPSH